MKAGSYVISPKSSGPALICRRSMPRMVPSWIGSSYFLPVRLSTIVRVSAMRFVVRGVGLLNRLAGDPVRSVGPTRQILHLAALAAERPPLGVGRLPPAEHAKRGVRGCGHPAILILRPWALGLGPWALVRSWSGGPWSVLGSVLGSDVDQGTRHRTRTRNRRSEERRV